MSNIDALADDNRILTGERDYHMRRADRLQERVVKLSAAIDDLFKLVQDKSQPMSTPENQALVNAGDVILVNEGALWNLRWVLMAHSPNPASQSDAGAEQK